MKIAILGFEREGRAAYDYWGPGNEITICDRNPDVILPPHVDSQLGEDYLHDLNRFHLVVRTPSLHPRDILAANDDRILSKITTGTEEFFRNCPANVIGVTGTKGKGTTSTLIAEILRAAGKNVHLGGNIGIAPLAMLKNNIQPDDWVVLEMSNFQLIDSRVAPHIAVCLMVAPEHLDWHTDMAEYIHSKQNMFRYQRDNDLAIFNRLNDYSTEVAGVSPALKISYEVPAIDQEPQEVQGAYVHGDILCYNDQEVCMVSDVKLLGRHNLENICAAVAATWELIDNNTALIKKVVSGFKGLPHRLEFVGISNGLQFYNDSFAATPEAAAAAIQAVPGKKVVICGGFDRGLDFTVIAKAVKQYTAQIEHMLLIGQSGPRIAKALEMEGLHNFSVSQAKTMPEVVGAAVELAKAGDTVLLSPGAPSFDMFKDFEQRGELFKESVTKL